MGRAMDISLRVVPPRFPPSTLHPRHHADARRRREKNRRVHGNGAEVAGHMAHLSMTYTQGRISWPI